MSKYLFANFAESVLAEELDASATSLTIDSDDASLFPSPATSESFLCALFDGQNAPEIVEVTARSSEVFTVTRARESTAAITWAAGTKVRNVITKGTLNAIALWNNETNGVEAEGKVGVPSGTAAAPSIYVIGNPDMGLFGDADEWGVSIEGVQVASFKAASTSLTGPLTVTGGAVTISGSRAIVQSDLGTVFDVNGTTNAIDIDTMTGATVGAAGVKGLVPAPSISERTLFLRGDGTWQEPADAAIAYAIALGG